jgi:hypothetical protein
MNTQIVKRYGPSPQTTDCYPFIQEPDGHRFLTDVFFEGHRMPVGPQGRPQISLTHFRFLKADIPPK